MKLFRVFVDRVDYDTYDQVIVCAESEEEIRNRLKRDERYKMTYFPPIEKDDETIYFEDSQGEIHIEEIGLDKTKIICASYNAG